MQVLQSMDNVYSPTYALLCIEDPFTEGNSALQLPFTKQNNLKVINIWTELF